MRTVVLGLLAETSIHPGAGRATGVVDLPVAREAATDYPVLVGSSLKGALRDKAETVESNDIEGRFGEPDKAGDLLISDGRLLLLPVRSLSYSYRWATCPYVIERYGRDLERAGARPTPPPQSVISKAVSTKDESDQFLEERKFATLEPPDGLVDAIAPLILHEDTRARLKDQLVVLSDKDFAWFARYGLSIQARNKLSDKDTKQSVSLWYEETLPPDTVLYSLITARNPGALDALDELFPDSDPYLQAGGNETVGQGWFAVRSHRDSHR